MMEKFAGAGRKVGSEFFDLNHTTDSVNLMSLMIPKLAHEAGVEPGRASESGH
jgi:hypothetical protein